MKKITLVVFVIAFLMTMICGCATITKTSQQMVSITSNVDGTAIFLDGEQVGETPFTGKIKKNKSVLTFKKDGYREETIQLSKHLDAMFWGNLCSGGLLGSTTDQSTGAAYTYSPETFHIEMKSDSQTLLDFDKQLKTRKFAMIYIDGISRDLATGTGEYLMALVQLVNPDANPADEIKLIRSALEASGGDQVRFGNAVVGLI